MPVLKMPPGRDTKLDNWAQMKAALRHAYIHLLDTHDWVLRADDITFVVMENLRLLLSDLDPSEPLYIGCRFKKHVASGFMSAGAGYVLSREAVVRMVRDGLPKELCRVKDGGAEDVEMGRCMEVLNATFLDSRDPLGRGRFFPFSPHTHIIPGSIPNGSWYWDMVYYPPASGFNCCSDSAIAFHDIGDQRMYALNYMVYHLRPYGISPHSIFNRTDIQINIT